MEVDPEDAELEAAKKASLKQIAEDEAKRWAIVLADVAREQEAALQAPVLEEPRPWWQAMDVDLPPAPPLPQGLLGQRWVFNGGAWEVEQAEEEQPPTPPAVVPPQAGGGPPAHLWRQPDYVILDGDDEEE